jgi:dipeptidase D
MEFAKTDAPAKVMNEDAQKSVINALYLVPNGVFRVSPGIAGLVETSNNLAKIELQNGKFTCHTLQRSSVESGKEDISTHIRIALESCGASVSQSGSYPGWRPNPDSKILSVMEQLYKDTFQENPHVMACHAGLECGIIGSKSPNMEMISFGPTIRSPHSPDEKVNIKSVQKFWSFLQKTLENIPAK